MKHTGGTPTLSWRRPTLLSVGEPDNPSRTSPQDDKAATHRARLRARLLEAGAQSLTDREVLELILTLGRPRRDPRPLARKLAGRFGSHEGAIAAPVEELRAVRGLGESGILALKIVEAAALRLVRAETVYRPTLNHWDRLIEYLTAVLAGERVDQARALFLDHRNRLIADEVQAQGRIAHGPAYPQELMARARDHQATALILVDNHPDSDPAPTRADLTMTQEIKRAAGEQSIVLHDHIVIGNGTWVSLKRLGLL